MTDAARLWRVLPETPVLPETAEALVDDRPELRRLRDGDHAVLEVLHRRHATAVYWTARALLDSAADAEEVTQDTFVLLWRKSRRIELVGSSLLPWLLTTVRFLVANILRTRCRRAAHLAELPDEAVAVARTEDAAITAVELSRVDALIAALPRADQDVYRLCVVEGLSYKQAACQLRTTHASVRNRLSRVRAALRKEVGR